MTNIKEELVVRKIAKPVNEVYVTAVRLINVKGEDGYQLELRQDFVREIENPGGLVGFTMLGNSSFSSKATNQRVCWQNFSAQQFAQLGLGITKEQVQAAPMQKLLLPNNPVLRMVVNGEPIRFQIVEQDSLTPRTWVDRNSGQLMTQTPKKAGQDGEVLRHEGQPIYANRVLAAQGGGINLSFEDYVIKHNNQIVGSTRMNSVSGNLNAITSEEEMAGQVVGNPTLIS